MLRNVRKYTIHDPNRYIIYATLYNSNKKIIIIIWIKILLFLKK